MKTKIPSLLLTTILLGTQAFAMDMMATDTMMKDKMKTESIMTKEEMLKINKYSEKMDIIALQEVLRDKGYLKIPAGVKLGFYGKLTSAAHTKMNKNWMMIGDTIMKK